MCFFRLYFFFVVFVCLFFICYYILSVTFFFFFMQNTAYERRISDWSSDVCSSDLCWKRVALAPLLRSGRGGVGALTIGTVTRVTGRDGGAAAGLGISHANGLPMMRSLAWLALLATSRLLAAEPAATPQ